MALTLFGYIKDDKVYDDETLEMLEEKLEEYIKGNIKGFTVEESMEFVRMELKKMSL